MITQSRQMVLICTIVLALLNSCKKEIGSIAHDDYQTISNDLKSFRNKVKNWHDSVVFIKSSSNQENNIKSISLSPEDIIVPSIDWNKSYINYNFNNKKSLTVELSINNQNGEILQMVVMSFKDSLIGYIFRTIPDSTYFSINKKANDFINYSGLVIAYDLNGKIKSKTRVLHGQPINNFSNSGKTYIIANDDFLDVHQLSTVTVYSTKNSPFLYYGWINIYSDSNLDSYDWYVPVGGGSQSQSEVPIIRNDIVNPCLSSIVNKILESRVADQLTRQLISVYGTNNKVNLTFRENFTSGLNAAYSSPYFDESAGTLNCIINIDLSKFDPNVSDEFVAATIIHEISHTLIAASHTNYNNYLAIDREKTMLIGYVESMKAFLIGNFNIDPKAASSMIYCGLGWLADKPDLNQNHPGYQFWNQETEDLYYQLIQDSGLSLTMNDPDYYTNYNTLFSRGELGKKSCKF